MHGAVSVLYHSNRVSLRALRHASRALRAPIRAVSGTAPAMNRSGKSDEDKAARKEAKKLAKAAKRAKREGVLTSGQKPCDLCKLDKDLLLRCQIDASKQWFMVCGKCWPSVSGGVVDGDEAHPHYKYGGIWKNKAASSSVTSAKQPKRTK